VGAAVPIAMEAAYYFSQASVTMAVR
jgi:hypothetical protein